MTVWSDSALSGGGHRDAESLFDSQAISSIRHVEATTGEEIEDKKEGLRQLVEKRYRDIIDSADSIMSMKSSCQTISMNISSIRSYIHSLSPIPAPETPKLNAASLRREYAIACRVKYLVDTPENIWGCLDEDMLLEAAARCVGAKHVHFKLMHHLNHGHSNFPLLHHQWQIVESFKLKIFQRSSKRLLDPGLGVAAYADALAAVALIDELDPHQVVSLFLDNRKSWVLKKLSALGDPAVSVFCEVVKIIKVSIGQVGELFLQVMNEMPLFYKTILASPPASQLFGGIPNPDEEVGLWNLFRENLNCNMGSLDEQFIANTCLAWLRDCAAQVVGKINGKYLIDSIASVKELAEAEKLIRETIDIKRVMEGSLDNSVYGTEIELPWSRIRELVLKDDFNLWDEMFEDAFVWRTKTIINSVFKVLPTDINLKDSLSAIGDIAAGHVNFQEYLNRPSSGGGIWFMEPNAEISALVPDSKALLKQNDFSTSLALYFGSEVGRIRDAVDNLCQSVLEDLLSFLESPKASLRLKDLVPFVQEKCYDSISVLLAELEDELTSLYAAMEEYNRGNRSLPPAIVADRSLFIGRLVFAFQHSKHIPVMFVSPRFWANDDMATGFDNLPSMFRKSRVSIDPPVSDSCGELPTASGGQASSATVEDADTSSPKLEELGQIMRDVCISAHNLWISWLSNELSAILAQNIVNDDRLIGTTSLRVWAEVVVKQDHDNGSQSDTKIYLPSMPSQYIISFLFRACEEIHRIGGHVLDESISQNFALRLLEKLIEIYQDFLSSREPHRSQLTDKGALQIILDLKFAADVLSGDDSSLHDELSKRAKKKISIQQKQDQSQSKSVHLQHIDNLLNHFSQRLDPIDWLTYKPYLWEIEKQSYVQHAVLFGFFVNLDTNTLHERPHNPESNIMRCSSVPRFKYLRIRSTSLSSRGATSAPMSLVSDDMSSVSSRSSRKACTDGELSPKLDSDNTSAFGVAAPILKSFIQVGSRFGESALKLSSILTQGPVSMFKDRSAAAMSTIGDFLSVQAAGLLSSFTANKSDS